MPAPSRTGRCQAPSTLDRLAAAITAPIVALLTMSWAQRAVWIVAAGLCCWSAPLGARWLGGVGRESAGGASDSALARAPLFTQAWAEQDQEQMLRFVLPANRAKLQDWLSARPVATAVAELQPAERSIKIIHVEPNEPEGVAITLQVNCRPANGKNWDFVQSQLWLPSAGAWYFAAESPATSEPVGQGPAVNRRGGRAHDGGLSAPTHPRDPPPAGGSTNVVIPSTVPPWQRLR